MHAFLKHIHSLDWLLVVPVVLIMAAGLVTNIPVDGFSFDSLFFRQAVFVCIGIGIMLIFSMSTYTVLNGPFVSLFLFVLSVAVLAALLLFAPEINGARSWFSLGFVAVQPVEFVKIALIIILARYFAARHIRIQHIRHVAVSFGVTAVLFALVFLQPDLGSSAIVLAIWVGMIFVSGVSKRHTAGLLLFAALTVLVGWQFLPDYQRERVLTFTAPLENLQSSGYTAHQSKIAVGSGEVFGKGIGEGTQSKLGFLPLHESDFVFAAFAEEWGFLGVMALFTLFGIVGWRIFTHALRGRTNFEILFAVGVFVFIFSHVLLHVGVNVGIVPVTGITMPFMSYGGSHIIAESVVLALLLGMTRLQFAGSFREMNRHRYG